MIIEPRSILHIKLDGDSSIASLSIEPSPLYRAQYECRHCLERFTKEELLTGDYVSRAIDNSTTVKLLIPHNCTPDIIGVADLQCFVKQ